MKKIIPILISLSMVMYSCTENKNQIEEQTTTDSTIGKVEIYDTAALKAIDSTAVIEVIAKGYTWSEGPVWLADKQMLLFTDVPENKMYQWKEGDMAKLYLTPSGYTGSIKRIGGEDGANGLALDKNGKLVVAGVVSIARFCAPIVKGICLYGNSFMPIADEAMPAIISGTFLSGLP